MILRLLLTTTQKSFKSNYDSNDALKSVEIYLICNYNLIKNDVKIAVNPAEVTFRFHLNSFIETIEKPSKSRK